MTAMKVTRIGRDVMVQDVSRWFWPSLKKRDGLAQMDIGTLYREFMVDQLIDRAIEAGANRRLAERMLKTALQVERTLSNN